MDPWAPADLKFLDYRQVPLVLEIQLALLGPGFRVILLDQHYLEYQLFPLLQRHHQVLEYQ